MITLPHHEMSRFFKFSRRLGLFLSVLLLLLSSQLFVSDIRSISWFIYDDTSAHKRENENNRGQSHNTEITITNYGWYHSNPHKGKQTIRCKAMRSFNHAIVSHERYNATAWYDLDQNPNPNRTIIAFLDIDACQLYHWPIFGGISMNADTYDGRVSFLKKDYNNVCPTIDQALKSPALAAPDSRLVVLSCVESGPGSYPCLRADRNQHSDLYTKLVVGHMSALRNETHPQDFGLPPWPVKTVTLNQSQNDIVGECSNESRPLLLSFQGRARVPHFLEFHQYFESLHGKQGVHAVFTVDHYDKSKLPGNNGGGKAIAPVSPKEQMQDIFYRLLMTSVFAAAPLGDCAYSVRFSEILSSGAIPVVYSDNWVLPYNRDVVDWSEVAVILPQRRVNETLDILKAIPEETRCEMRKKGYQIYKDYVADSAGRLRAILKIMDAALSRRRKMRGGIPVDSGPMEFSAAPERRRLYGNILLTSTSLW